MSTSMTLAGGSMMPGAKKQGDDHGEFLWGWMSGPFLGQTVLRLQPQDTGGQRDMRRDLADLNRRFATRSTVHDQKKNAVALSRPARVMGGTAIGTPCRLGIPGLNGREFLPKGHLLRLMIALSVL
jgi:hypothetical protein